MSSIKNNFHSSEVSKNLFHDFGHFSFLDILNEDHYNRFPRDSSLLYLKLTIETPTVVLWHHGNNDATVLQTASDFSKQAISRPEIRVPYADKGPVCANSWLKVMLK